MTDILAADDYAALLAKKEARAMESGFTPDSPLPGYLKDFQKVVVRRMLERGRAAAFEECGLGKTLQQLTVASFVCDHTQGRYLILVPLAVARQTVLEAVKFGVGGVAYHRTQAEADAAGTRIVVTNYDCEKDFDPSAFSGVGLDESSILKGNTSATRKRLTDRYSRTRFRHCWTATPAPNDHVELGNHAEFLGVMSATAMLSRFFVHDSMNTSEWRLKGHATDDFWRWVLSWSDCIGLPSDAGGDDDGYILPSLEWREITVETHDGDDGKLVPDGTLSATQLYRSLRRTLAERVEEARKLVEAEPGEYWVMWCNTNEESAALAAAIPGAVEVRGDMSPAEKEARVGSFGRVDGPKVLVTKPTICGFGMNWQFCARTAFVGLSYSFEQVYQAIRRFWRFGQTREVFAYLITADTEVGVLESVRKKMAAHETMRDAMRKANREVGDGKTIYLFNAGKTWRKESGRGWEIVNADCVEYARTLESNSVGYQVFSPPFASLYTYTDLPEDMGNCGGDDEFFEQYRFLAAEQFRIAMPGRLLSFHCMLLPSTIERNGYTGLRDFRGDLIRLYQEAGFHFHSEVVIWKDPLVAMQRTKAIGLLHKQLCKDSARSRQGISDYLITMVKPGENMVPIAHGAGLTEWIGEGRNEPQAMPTDDARTNKRGHEIWQRYASPVWMDIDPTRVLPYRGGRGEKDERHICPLQLQVIERGLCLWSAPGDVVFSPFTGVGSEGFETIRKGGRTFIGCELKESYFDQAVLNLRNAESLGGGQMGLDLAA